MLCSIRVISIFADLFDSAVRQIWTTKTDLISVPVHIGRSNCVPHARAVNTHLRSAELADNMQEISVINAGAATASVPANPGRVLALEHSGAFAYTHDERTAIDAANEAFSPVIDAVNKYEDIDGWVPPLVRGVRALRDRAMRDTGALNHQDNEYRKTFGDLLNAEPIGPWLLDKSRHSLLNAVHYLGSDDSYLETFMDWRARIITDDQRSKWRSLRTLVDHFKDWQSGISLSKDRRTSEQKEIERVRTEGHKADAALLAEVEQARRELATGAMENCETFWTVLDQAGPEKFVQTLKAHDAKDYARMAHELLGAWLKEASG